MQDFAAARANMIVSQLRPNAVTDGRILEAMARLPRERFVAAWQVPLAYMDTEIESAPGRFLLAPMILARLVQLAAIRAGDKVLHVGAASGYATALIAALAGNVVAIGQDEAGLASAAGRLAALGVANARFERSAHAEGFAAAAPYDAIVVTGRIPEIPDTLLSQLAAGGRLAAIAGADHAASGVLVMRDGTAFSRRTAFDAAAAALPGFAGQREAFVF